MQDWSVALVRPGARVRLKNSPKPTPWIVASACLGDDMSVTYTIVSYEGNTSTVLHVKASEFDLVDESDWLIARLSDGPTSHATSNFPGDSCNHLR